MPTFVRVVWGRQKKKTVCHELGNVRGFAYTVVLRGCAIISLSFVSYLKGLALYVSYIRKHEILH